MAKKIINLQIEIDVEKLKKIYKMVGKEDLFSTDFVKGFANKLNMKDFDDNYVIKVLDNKSK